MPKNPDGSVTVATPGKTKNTPRGSGTGQVKTPAAKANPASGPKVVRTPGRGAVPRTKSGK